MSAAFGEIGGTSIAGLEKRKTSVYAQSDIANSIARVKSRKFALVVMVIYVEVFASGHVLTNLESGD